jgi:hypothetical protein
MEPESAERAAAFARFRVAEAHFRLEPSEWTRPEVVDAAVELLVHGVDGPNLATLAGEDGAEWREVERYLNLALRDLGEQPLDASGAFRIVVDAAARDLVADRIDPATAAARIARACVANDYQLGEETRDLAVAAQWLDDVGDAPDGPLCSELRDAARAYLDRDPDVARQ